jgi:8-oxo-dGTP diphosphatase
MLMHKHPSKQDIRIATDAAIFTVQDGKLKALLIQMKKSPFTGDWALPGGLIGENETTRNSAIRILAEQTGVRDVYIEQLMTFDDPKRDPLGRVISVAWFALIPDSGRPLRTTEKYMDVRWWPVAKLPKLAYDHAHIAQTAIARLRAKLGYANVAWSLLPPIFTLSDLQKTHEAILGKSLDKRNFQKKILASGLLKATGKTSSGGAHRPARLYRFAKFV